MALSKQDKEMIASTVALAIKESAEPVQKQISDLKDIAEKHHYTLFGPDGNNGIYGDMKNTKKDIGKLKKIYSAVGAIITMLLVFKDKILAMLNIP